MTTDPEASEYDPGAGLVLPPEPAETVRVNVPDEEPDRLHAVTA